VRIAATSLETIVSYNLEGVGLNELVKMEILKAQMGDMPQY